MKTRALAQVEGTKDINVMSISVGKRWLATTTKHIDTMAESIQKQGQLQPIIVCPVARGTYRLIAGASRHKAMLKLGVQKIRATIMLGSEIDYQIIELEENLIRKELSHEQKQEMKDKIRALERERFADVEPAKAGRGKKGGMREAARQAGTAETTARRRKQEAKSRQKSDNGANSSGAKSTSTKRASTARNPVRQIGVRFSREEADRLDQYRKAHNSGSLSDSVRMMVRDFLDRAGISIKTKGTKDGRQIAA